MHLQYLSNFAIFSQMFKYTWFRAQSCEKFISEQKPQLLRTSAERTRKYKSAR